MNSFKVYYDHVDGFGECYISTCSLSQFQEYGSTVPTVLLRLINAKMKDSGTWSIRVVDDVTKTTLFSWARN